MRETIRFALLWLCAAEKRMLAMAAGVGLLAALTGTALYAERAQADIANGVVRLHILANSDREDDQAVKLLVRDALLPALTALLAEADGKASACDALEAALPDIAKTAEAVLLENGYVYGAQAGIARAYFPTREYGDIALPAGPYDALRIELGTGEGRNWWCMVFPPLCYVDITQAAVSAETSEALEAVLTTDGAALVTGKGDSAWIRFALVELWQEWKAKWKQ